jgi:uncharacterized protein (DUF433 family)
VDIEILDRPVYGVSQAASLLRTPTQTFWRWLDGYEVNGVVYEPVIRQVSTGSELVTWGEFVEGGLLRGYRNARVPLQKMRPYIVRARQVFNVPYPLAHFRPLIDNRDLVEQLQDETGLPSSLHFVRSRDGQLYLSEIVEEFLKQVEFDPVNGDVVIKIRPLRSSKPVVSDPEAVVIDPQVSFGSPQIRGIRTDLIAESHAVGGLDEARRGWNVTEPEVEAALEWEKRLAKAA